MLTIRKAQLKAFELVKPDVFIPIMIKRLADKFPALTQVIGEEGLTKIIEEGINKCKKYGIEIAYETGVFIEMSVFFGTAFDSDPLIKWAGEILNNRQLNSAAKIESLKSSAIEYMNNTLADDMIYPVPQFNKIIQSSYEDLATAFENISLLEFSDYLKKFWPGKFKLLVPEDIESFFELHSVKGEEFGFKSNETKYYYILLMFLLGYHFDIDPQYPWINELLNDPQYDEELYKTTSLHFIVQKILQELLEIEQLTND